MSDEKPAPIEVEMALRKIIGPEFRYYNHGEDGPYYSVAFDTIPKSILDNVEKIAASAGFDADDSGVRTAKETLATNLITHFITSFPPLQGVKANSIIENDADGNFQCGHISFPAEGNALGLKGVDGAAVVKYAGTLGGDYKAPLKGLGMKHDLEFAKKVSSLAQLPPHRPIIDVIRSESRTEVSDHKVLLALQKITGIKQQFSHIRTKHSGDVAWEGYVTEVPAGVISAFARSKGLSDGNNSVIVDAMIGESALSGYSVDLFSTTGQDSPFVLAVQTGGRALRGKPYCKPEKVVKIAANLGDSYEAPILKWQNGVASKHDICSISLAGDAKTKAT